MNYAIYSPADGKIMRIISCPTGHALGQLALGEALLPDVTGTITDATHKIEGGQFVALPAVLPSPAEIRAGFVKLAQQRLDSYARGWGYDDLRSAVSYVGDPNPRFAAEALALRNWRSQVWTFLDENQVLPDPLPTAEEFLALLPAAPARP